MRKLAAIIVVLLIIAGAGFYFLSGESATLAVEDGYGPNPKLPEPNHTLIPTVNLANASSWPAGAKPKPADGMNVVEFAGGLDHPRWLYVLPNGDVLVAETNAPPKPEDEQGIRGWIMRHADEAGRRRRAERQPHHAAARRRRRRRRRDARRRSSTGLNSPFGMALVGGELYVANTDAVVRFPYKDGATEITAAGEKVADLPAGPINHHWTKNVIASPDGTKLYATVGSNSNVGENGMDDEEQPRRDPRDRSRDAARRGCSPRACAIRTAWPGSRQTGALWTVVNERDEIGSDLVPDYMTSVKDGGFYGWPYSYYGQHVDDARRAAAARPGRQGDRARLRARAAHGVARPRPSTTGDAVRRRATQGGAFVGQHGSWNRKPRSGYKVIFVPFADGKPSGIAEGRPDRLPQRRRRSAWAGRSAWRSTAGRAAGRRRRRQHGLAGHAASRGGDAVERRRVSSLGATNNTALCHPRRLHDHQGGMTSRRRDRCPAKKAWALRPFVIFYDQAGR